MENVDVVRMICFNVVWLAREEKVLLKDVEAAAGVSIGYFSRVRAGRDDISFMAVYRTAKFLRVTVDELCKDQRYEKLAKDAEMMGYKLVPVGGATNDVQTEDRESVAV